MPRRQCLLVLFLLAAVSIGARASYASCMMPDTPCREFVRTPFVFQGLVESVAIVEHQDQYFGETGGRLWRVKVERAWKGLENQAQAQIVTRGVPGKTWVDNEFAFKIGERYVIWAWPTDTPPVLRTSGCSLTRAVKDAREELAFLDGLSGPAAGGYVYGRVSGGIRPWSNERPGTAGVTVVLEGAGTRREARTDEEGRFRFSGLQQDHYDVFLVLPETLAPFRVTPADPHSPRSEAPVRASIDISGRRDCASANFLVESSALISGFAAAADGTPIGGIIVQGALLDHLQQQDANRAKGKFAYLFSAKAVTDARGYFEFLNLPVGRYVVGISLEYDTNADQPYPRLFYPGVTDVADAVSFDLKPGERLDVGAFTLPPRLAPVVVEGRVVRHDGEPVAEAAVSVTNEFKARLRGTQADKTGRFSLSLFPGYSYTLTAFKDSGKDGLEGRAVVKVETGTLSPTPVQIEVGPRVIVAPATGQPKR